MKKSLIIIVAIVMIAGLTSRVMAQSVTDTKSNSANATVLSAISLAVNQALEFGAFVPHATIPGTVTMGITDNRGFTVVTLVTGTVTPKSAQYTTSGTKLAAYTITIPTSSFNITNTSSGNSETMAITGMSCTGGLTHQIGAGGTDVFKLGGNLAVAAAQADGLYTGTFDVTVAY
jgi:hypothetical protein